MKKKCLLSERNAIRNRETVSRFTDTRKTSTLPVYNTLLELQTETKYHGEHEESIEHIARSVKIAKKGLCVKWSIE